MLNISNLRKWQENLGASSVPPSQRISTMDPFSLNLSFNLVTKAATKRPFPTFFPSVTCDYITERLSPAKKRKFASPPSSPSPLYALTYFDVYGDVQGGLSNADSFLSKPSKHQVQGAGSSRVLAAWKKSQSWSSLSLKGDARVRESRSSGAAQSCLMHDDYGYGRSKAQPGGKVHSCADSMNSDIQLHRKACPSRQWSPHLSPATPCCQQTHTMSKREASVTAITQALTPSLYPHKKGQGELALRMAHFLSSFKSSAQTNEVNSCEEEVWANLDSMFKGAQAAEEESRALESWLNAAEDQLRAIPSVSDVHHLEVLLDNLECHSRGQEPSCLSSNDHCQKGASRAEQLNEIAQVTKSFEDNVGNLLAFRDIQQIEQKFEETLRGMTRHSHASKEAVNNLHLAVARGEVAWLKNLETSATCLEAIAHNVLPLEGLYTSPSHKSMGEY